MTDIEPLIAADQLLLTRYGYVDGSAVLEVVGTDVWDDGTTFEAYVFTGVEYMEVPVLMEDVRVRPIIDAPGRVPREARIFDRMEGSMRVRAECGTFSLQTEMKNPSGRCGVGARQPPRLPVGLIILPNR